MQISRQPLVSSEKGDSREFPVLIPRALVREESDKHSPRWIMNLRARCDLWSSLDRIGQGARDKMQGKPRICLSCRVGRGRADAVPREALGEAAGCGNLEVCGLSQLQLRAAGRRVVTLGRKIPRRGLGRLRLH